MTLVSIVVAADLIFKAQNGEVALGEGDDSAKAATLRKQYESFKEGWEREERGVAIHSDTHRYWEGYFGRQIINMGK